MTKAKGARVVEKAPAGLRVRLAGIDRVPPGLAESLARQLYERAESVGVYGLVIGLLVRDLRSGPGQPLSGTRLHWAITEVLPGKLGLARQAMRMLGQGLTSRTRRAG